MNLQEEREKIISEYNKNFQNKKIKSLEDKNVDWNWISRKQTLSEDFIREFKDKVYWKSIYEYQKL